MKQGSALLGRRPQRLPRATPPPARPQCESDTLEAPEESTDTASNPQVRARRRVRRAVEQSPKVRAQVKQLKFWLKVFSRFCHDDSEHGDV